MGKLEFMLIDSHAHLDFYDDPTEILVRAEAAGVAQMLAIGIGDGPATMHRALDLARQHGHVFASAGIHPQEAHQATPEALEKLRALVADPKCIAVGEIGLDYYHLENPDIEVQQQAFVAQLAIAAEAGKPILIHCRTSDLATAEAKARFGPADAFADIMRLIAEHWTPAGIPGVMHCFSGSPEQAKQALAANFYLSFAGNVTYPKSLNIREAAAQAPADRYLVETDCPFLAPIPFRGKQNEPAYVTHTAEVVAELRGVGAALVAEQTTANFHTLFPSTARS
ncbi:hydrolase, TatD family [Granulicella tundricola MP5ACTX9]|uniref:Hydrolase, TatD family n=2 Tax=Granulicella TaxID=940557 RepID=E8WWH1_GRATM|nr:hydrolase, TatD family [Granulicella tundricola MP5ACTX9]